MSDHGVALLHEADDLHLEVGKRAAERPDPPARDLREDSLGDLVEDLGAAPLDALFHEPAYELLVVAHERASCYRAR